MKLTLNNWKEYFRTKISGTIPRILEDRIVKFIQKLLDAKETQLEKAFKVDRSKQKTLL